ncbi:1-deoxyxylulose-5-phosphate synthase YajO-like [Littorina saxatilis]|uniref:NADP-dependent oxidoreductase domain-containing protein n=1 Tax=Littorina saxatilis TaxID=31220 RepID=A0AAN9AWY9_9CAEN
MESVPETARCQYTYLGKSGLRVSNICLGTMTFGKSHIGSPSNLSEADSHAVIQRFVQWGGNFLDTADGYGRGDSERVVGTWLKNQERDRFVVGTKFFNTMDSSNPNAAGCSRRHITNSISNSLQRLQTDYVDLYQVQFTDG